MLPHLVIHVSESGELTAAVDGESVEPPPTGTWTRGRFGDLLDLVTAGRTVAVRVEVHESDGSTFTDLIHAHRRRTPPPAEEPAKTSGKHTARRRSEPIEVTGDGFVPGEQVVIAVVTAATAATNTGQATAAIRPKEARRGEVVLIGRVSGTVCVRRLP
ncbi:MAG: hypothetical protein ACK5MT_21515 [Actinomycetales bacterium]